MNRNPFPATIVMVSCLFCGTATADVYRWTDIDGNVHFGDRPQYVDEPIEVKTADVGDPDAAPDPAAEAPDADARGENCDVASKRLAEYEAADQLIGEDEYGRKREIAGEERIELILRAQKDVEEFCGEATASAPSEPAPAKSTPAAEVVEPEVTPAEAATNEEPAAAAITEEGSLSSY